jgi:uncharacterized membrane protein
MNTVMRTKVNDYNLRVVIQPNYLDTLRNYFENFLVYAVLGWIYESIWCCMIYHKRGFINRGFLFGPWLPIYGIGFFIILGIFKFLKVKKPLGVFIIGTLVATIAELSASYIIDMVVGTPMWDYKGYFMNFDGRIALEPSMMFGVMICIAICLIQPVVVRFQEKTRENNLRRTCDILAAGLFAIDLLSRIWLGSNCVG